MVQSGRFKWQPVMLLCDERLDCDMCGALATFVILERQPDTTADETYTGVNYGHSAWCQECLERAQEESES